MTPDSRSQHDAPFDPQGAASEPAHTRDHGPASPYFPPPVLPRQRGFAGWWLGVRAWVRDYFLAEDPSFPTAIVPLCFLSMILYTRWPGTNFIFDEQEALLANPYVRSIVDHHSKLGWGDAFTRDFWGLTPDRTIGSYRPIPNLIWRALWGLGANERPFLHHWVCVLFHGFTGALVTVFVLHLTKRRGLAWLAGGIFVASAVITEAVSGVVGIADVMGGLGAILGLLALTQKTWVMPLGVFVGTLLSLYSKETALVMVPLLPLAALFTSQMTHPERPMRWARAALAFVGAFAAFYIYVELRRVLFPVKVPDEYSEAADVGKGLFTQLHHGFMRWYAQPVLPHDPLNNPLIEASSEDLRVAGALRVWWRGLAQVVFPGTLSGDYSAPQEPVPDRPVFVESVLGLACMALPLVIAPLVGFFGWLRFRRAHPTPAREQIFAVLAPIGVLTFFGAAFMGILGMKGDFSSTFLGILRWNPPDPVVTDPDVWAMWRVTLACILVLVTVIVVSAAVAISERSLGKPPPFPEDRDLVHPELESPRRLASLAAFSALWVVVSFFPVSNIVLPLPTVRAERFWYYPVIGSAIFLAIALVRLRDAAVSPERAPLATLLADVRSRSKAIALLCAPALGLKLAWATLKDLVAKHAYVMRYVILGLTISWFGFECVAARLHANDYTNDLIFWDATRRAVPNSAKAHLNYSVMLGARGDLAGRYESNKRGYELAPTWPMASVYLGDTLCRWALVPVPEGSAPPQTDAEKARKLDEAGEAYVRGFDLAPNDSNLIALGLQCLWDAGLLPPDVPAENEEKKESPLKTALVEVGKKHPGSWLDYLVRDTIDHGAEHHGVDPKYRPRGYNEGPKGE